MAVALYPGAFKPPHRGHFEVVEKLLKGNHGGKVYNLDDFKQAGQSILSGEKSEVNPITKVYVIIGGGVRNGLTAQEAKSVWDIYKKYLGNVEVVVSDLNPMMTAKDIAKQHPNEKFYAVTGIRSEEDIPDLRRISTFKSRDNVQGLAIGSDEGGTRATDFRKALLSGNLDQIIDFFPKQLSKNEILKIVNMLKKSIIAEMMLNNLDNTLNNLFNSETNEASSGTPIAPKSDIRSEDRAQLVRVYNQLRNVLGDNYYNIDFKQDHINVSLKDKTERRDFDYTPYMASILEYMIDEGMKITPLPEIKIKKDIAEGMDFFGRTAYYNPSTNEIVLYTHSRHPKDVMRSFAHEMIHHMQNLDGRLQNIQTTNTNEDGNLLELEKEAYLMGNITFRNWEDKIKNNE